MSNSRLTITENLEPFLQEALARETLRSERQRLAVLLGFLAVAFATFLVLAFFPGLVAETTRHMLLPLTQV